MITKLAEQRPGFYGCAYVALIIAYFAIYVVFHYGLGLPESWVDGAYLSVVTITTLGFGDVTPSTDLGKIVVSSQEGNMGSGLRFMISLFSQYYCDEGWY